MYGHPYHRSTPREREILSRARDSILQIPARKLHQWMINKLLAIIIIYNPLRDEEDQTKKDRTPFVRL